MNKQPTTIQHQADPGAIYTELQVRLQNQHIPYNLDQTPDGARFTFDDESYLLVNQHEIGVFHWDAVIQRHVVAEITTWLSGSTRPKSSSVAYIYWGG